MRCRRLVVREVPPAPQASADNFKSTLLASNIALESRINPNNGHYMGIDSKAAPSALIREGTEIPTKSLANQTMVDLQQIFSSLQIMGFSIQLF
jgi:hypothetical protein